MIFGAAGTRLPEHQCDAAYHSMARLSLHLDYGRHDESCDHSVCVAADPAPLDDDHYAPSTPTYIREWIERDEQQPLEYREPRMTL